MIVKKNKQTGQQNTAWCNFRFIYNIQCKYVAVRIKKIFTISTFVQKFSLSQKTNTVNFYINVSIILTFIFVRFCSTRHHRYNTCYSKPDTLIKHLKPHFILAKKHGS